MGRRFQSGDRVIFPVPSVLNGQDGGPRTLLVVGKANTSAYQAPFYTRSSGAHGWWMEIDTTGGLHVNYGTGTTARPVGSVTTGSAAIWTARKDNAGSVQPIGRHFTGSSFGTDSGDVTAVSTLIDGTAIDTSYGLQCGGWGNSPIDSSNDLELYFIAVWNSLLSGATLAALTKTAVGIKAGSPDYWISFEGSGTPTDSASGSPTVTGTTTVSDPSGFFGSGGLTQALPTASETSSALALGRSKRRALPVSVETDAAPAFGRVKRRLLPVGVETGTAVPLGKLKRRALPTALEANTAVAFGRSKRRALPVAAEADVAMTFGRVKRAELPVAHEYDVAVVLAGGSSEGDDAMNLGNLMDEMAARLRTIPELSGRTYPYPPASIKAPAGIVTYPSEITYDATYGRGMDRLTAEVVIVVGRPQERQSRDRITKYVDGSGPSSVKAVLDGRGYSSCSSVRVASGAFDVITIGGTSYLAAVFSIDIVGKGAPS